jgi:hypothetical protein
VRRHPDGSFGVAGEADALPVAYRPATAKLELNYLRPASSGPGGSAPLVQVFDPSGTPVNQSFAGRVTISPTVTGVHTALVSAFGSATSKQETYRVEFHDDSVLGPTITYFGLTDGETKPLKPIGYNTSGSPIYNQPFGSGGSLVIEARAGESNAVRAIPPCRTGTKTPICR